jgi:hypothetical protein
MELTIPLSEIIGLRDQGRRWQMRELYPRERWTLIDGRTRWDWGDGVRLSVAPKSVMLFEIMPESSPADGPRWYGIGGGETIAENVRRFVEENNGTFPVALELPRGRHVSAVGTSNVEEREPFESIPVWHRDGVAPFDRTVPPAMRVPEPVQREITDWVVQPGSLQEGIDADWIHGIDGEPTRFPLDTILTTPNHDLLMEHPCPIQFEGGNVGKFMGTVLCNPWFWDMPLEVRWETAPGSPPDSEPVRPEPEPAPSGPRQFEETSEYWLSTTLNLMAVQRRTFGYTPPFNEHMFIPLPFADYKRIEEIRAWINGIPAPVERMDYLLTPPFFEHFEHGTRDFMFYLDGSRDNLHENIWNSDPNGVVVWVRWADSP